MKKISKENLKLILDQSRKHYLKNAIDLIELEDIEFNEFVFKDLPFLQFEGINLHFSNCVFVNCSLSSSVFRLNSQFKNCRFLNCNLSKIIFVGELTNVLFLECDLFESEMIAIDIFHVNFIRCDFSAFLVENSRINNSLFYENNNFNSDCIKNNEEVNVKWI